MRLTNNRTRRKIYIPPLVGVFCLTDVDTCLLATSIGTFEDMGSGGDLGGDTGNTGSFNDLIPGGSLGEDITKEDGSFSDMLWGGDLGGTVIGN
ncbi:MAG: hypothetical protein J6N73_08695 [Prevotella sp.]|nr:hypothetical protein [Prevotella sp.]